MFDLNAMNAPRLAGRDDVLQSMHAHLDGGVLIVSHRGSTGIGATTLARRLAVEARKKYPDGCIEVNLRGSAPAHQAPPASESIHRRVLMMLDSETVIPENPRALRKRYQETLAQHKALLILDDASSATQLRALLPRSGSTAIVTAHSDFTSSFPRLYAVTLGGLALSDVYNLMIQVAPGTTSLSRQNVRRIASRLEGIPLALRIAAAMLGRSNQLSPRNLLRKLEIAQQRIVALRGAQTPNTPIDIALEVSYDMLDPELKRYFEALAIFPAPFMRSAAAAVWEVPVSEAQDVLEQLTHLALVDHHGTSALYEVHQQVRTFAQELLLGQRDRSGALVAHYVGHYLRTAVQTSSTLSTLRPRNKNQKLDPYAVWDHIPIAWQRLNGKDPGWPAPPDMRRWIRDFPLHSRPLLNSLISESEYRDWLALSLSAAEEEGDARTLCALLSALGQAYADIEEHETALTHFERQITLALENQARDLEAEAHMHAGSSYKALGQAQRASNSWRKALVIFELVGDRRTEQIRSWLALLHQSP